MTNRRADVIGGDNLLNLINEFRGGRGCCEQSALGRGELTFTDVTVNESTGMVNVRAVFPNPDKVLLPGLYVRANLVEGVRPDSIVIPMQCVMRDAKGNASVWVIDAENKIATRKITASRSIGTSWLVESGLKAGDRVVFEGFQRTRAGATVSPKEADASKMLDKTGKSLY